MPEKNPNPQKSEQVIKSADEFIAQMEAKKKEKKDGPTSNQSPMFYPRSNPRSSSKGKVLNTPQNLTNLVPNKTLKDLPEIKPTQSNIELLPISRGEPYSVEFEDVPFSRYLVTKLDYEYWERDGSYPSFEELKEWSKRFNSAPSTQKEWQELFDEISIFLVNRGLPLFETFNKGLDPEFVLAANALCNVTDKRSKSEKLREVELTSAQFTAMMRKKPNREYFLSRLDKTFDEDVGVSAKLAIARAIEVGDMTAVKYYHEFTGKYRPAEAHGNTTELFGMFLQAIMQALARHVTSEIISQVAAEIREAPAIQKVLGAIEAEAS